MSAPSAAPGPASSAVHAPDVHEEVTEGLPPGFGPGIMGKVAFWIAVAFSLFQLWTAGYGTLPSQVVRAMHVGFLLLLGFGLVGNLLARTAVTRAIFWGLGLIGFGTGIYNWVLYEELIRRTGFLTHADLVVGTVLVVLVFEASRRLMGWPLAIIAGLFLAYCFLGQHMPPPFIHRGYDFEQIVEHFAFGTEGDLRHADLCELGLYLHLRGLRGLPRTGGDAEPLQRFRARPRGRRARRACTGGGAFLGADGDDLGLGRGQCGGLGPVHHPDDEALRASSPLSRAGSRPRPRWAGRSCRR